MDGVLEVMIQDLNLNLTIYINNEAITNVQPPSFINGCKIWDVGFINPYTKDFIEVNAFCKAMPEEKAYLDFTLKFLKFLNQTPNINLKRAFGFDAKGYFKIDDYLLEEIDFENAMKSFGIPFVAPPAEEGEVEQY